MSAASEPSAERRVRVVNPRGLHARASAMFVKLADRFAAEITVEKDGQKACGTSIMGLMLLAAARGEDLTISASGADAEAAVEALAGLIEQGFEEEAF